jgi:NAD(P)-dependent dehydrogenase (short-subunit alcohol dehydrogenase family)
MMNGSLFTLENKTIVVTGASSGLGASIATECSKQGAKLYITGRDSSRLQTTYDHLFGKSHYQNVVDLLSEKEIIEYCQKLPKIDGLVLCAGIFKTMPVKRNSRQAIEEMFQTNLFSSMLMVQSLLKMKKINIAASIVFLSSIAANQAYVGNSIYSTTKGALDSFMRVSALELANRKITCNSIAPGIVPSRMSNSEVFAPDQLREEEKKYPLGFGDPVDIAAGAIYLLSSASRWVTGTVLKIDGGATLK